MDQIVVENNNNNTIFVDLMFSITRGDQSERSRAYAATRNLSAIEGI